MAKVARSAKKAQKKNNSKLKSKSNSGDKNWLKNQLRRRKSPVVKKETSFQEKGCC